MNSGPELPWMCDQLQCRNGAVRMPVRPSVSQDRTPNRWLSSYPVSQLTIWSAQITARKPTMTQNAFRASATMISAVRPFSILSSPGGPLPRR